MKVLPIKMPDDLYYDLKRASKASGVSMAQIIKSQLKKTLTRQQFTQQCPKVTKVEEKPAQMYGWMDEMVKNAYKGKGYHADKTDDELLYGNNPD